jgi:hypothetical protein
MEAGMKTLALWYEIVHAQDSSRLSEVLAENCVFFSPVVHTPQSGRALTELYLTGAMQVFNDSFRYVKEVVNADHAVLEFLCEVDGIAINGVDIMSFDEDGRIIEFKVMIRPLKAVHMIHEKMKSMLEQLA